jgi:vanillate O-demethylase ferredoxin subunit
MKGNLIAARVVARERVANDVVSLRFVSHEVRMRLPAFEAGAHIDLHLHDGLTRKYSLSNDPSECGVYEIAVKREPESRGGSAYLHDTIRIGDVLSIGPPQNYFPLASDDSPSVLLAAGIGVTPLLAMAHSLRRAGRAFAFHYFVRSLDSAAYWQALQGHLADVSTLHVGLNPVSTSAMIEHIVARIDTRAHLYFCGPGLFMDAADSVARTRLCAERIHQERFSTSGAGVQGPGEFEVELARSKRVLTVPSDRSITDLLHEQGVLVEVSCEAGICGACRTAVLAGTPDHRDVFLSAAEKARNDAIMPCVSRCKTARLVLDI